MIRFFCCFSFFLLLFTGQVISQTKINLRVLNSSTGEALEGVSVSTNKKTIAVTGKDGEAILSLTQDKVSLHFSSVGFLDSDTLLTTPFPQSLYISLTEETKGLEDVTVVASTRNNQRIENSPLKVEVLGREEMDEESSIKPAGIASILGDVSGVQIQQSSAVTGNANVRIQGLDGRYTQILKDGMPLYDGFSGGFGILSIPPLDLKQIELIKGSASTLYGGGAIGGLVNIISRTPILKQSAVLSVNETTLKETNINTYLSKRYAHLGYTFFGGWNRQKAVDVDHDGFSDVPDMNGLVVHPRLFLYPGNNTTLMAGYTGTFEKRNGGDMRVLIGKSDSIHRYYEENRIARNSFEFTANHRYRNKNSLDFKSSISSFERKISSSDLDFTGKQTNYYTELSVLQTYGIHNSFVGGVNATGEQFRKVTDNIPLNNYSNNTIGFFAQNTWNIKEKATIEAGLRDDYQFIYGNFLLPRLAVFYRLNEHWATRAGIGFGYKIPNALAPQNVDYPIQNIQPLPKTVTAERSIGYNAELNYKIRWNDADELFINQAFFLTKLNNPLVAEITNNGDVTFSNMAKPIISKGSDTYIRAVIKGWELYAGYTLTLAERKYLSTQQFIPLTPKNRFAFTIVRDFEDIGLRLGIEGSYTGPQHRENYSLTPGYFFMAAMLDKKIGKHISIVLNGENLLDYRQSKVEPLFTGSVSNPVFKPLWAPIDGRVINLSVKWQL